MSLRRIKTNTDNSEFKLRTENRSGRKYYYFNTASKLVGLFSFGLTIVNPANARVILDQELCHSLQSVFLLACSRLSIGGSERKQRRARKGIVLNFVLRT